MHEAPLHLLTAFNSDSEKCTRRDGTSPLLGRVGQALPEARPLSTPPTKPALSGHPFDANRQ